MLIDNDTYEKSIAHTINILDATKAQNNNPQ